MSSVNGMEEDEVAVIPDSKVEEDLSEDGGDLYFCRSCGSLITSGGERTAVDGGHVHTFVNPAGYIFRIGCFRSAPGCRSVGAPTAEFTWFSGRPWAFATCAHCASHLGWVYFQGGKEEFFGLILDQLRRGEDA